MDNKYNQLHLEQYSKALAKLLCDRYFTEHETVNGPQLISFMPVKQVNLFVIKELLLKWNNEVAHLRSPFFDFESPEVKDALVQFMNVLSRKILIRRTHFEPLLQKAIYDTLLLAVDPVGVFDEKFLRVQAETGIAKMQENLKYIDQYKEAFSNFLQSVSGTNLNRDYILSKLRLYFDTHPKEIIKPEVILDEFDAILPVYKTEEKPVEAAVKQFDRKPEPEPAPVVAKPEPVQQAQPVVPKPQQHPEPVSTQVAPQPKPQPVAATATPRTATAENNINERFKAEKSSLNDIFKKPAPATLADNMGNKKIDSLKNSISINQRFSFINELFDGDNMAYHAAIKTLDDFDTAEATRNYLLQDIGSKHDWSRKDEHVQKMLRLIDRKFM